MGFLFVFKLYPSDLTSKKNILLGIKTLDITNDLMKILNEEVEQKNLLNEN